MPKRVLFVCTANRCRSVMAEYVFRQMLADLGVLSAQDIEVLSAGIVSREATQLIRRRRHEVVIPRPFFGQPPPETLAKFMQERGIDVSPHRSRRFNKAIADSSDLILCVEPQQKETILSRYPDARGKVFTFKEFVKRDGFLLLEREHPAPEAVDQAPFEAFLRKCFVEIEECLKQGMPGFLQYLSGNDSLVAGQHR